MSVETQHKEYTGAAGKWTRCRDVVDGEDAVKAKRQEYLPKTSTKQKPAAYTAYLTRALFYGATGRTVQGLTGAIFGKAPVIQAPKSLDAHLNDVTLSGIPIQSFAQDRVTEVLTVGRDGVLLDIATGSGADARPYWISYAAENVINWRTTTIGGDTKLTRVVLRECVEEADSDDTFSVREKVQYRVCELIARPPKPDGTPSTAPAVYQVTVWKQATKDGGWSADAPVVPTRRGEALTFIPFVFFNPSNLLPSISKPPLLDLVNVNLSHYRSSADLEHGAHYTALPQPVVSGYEGESLEIGASVAWVLKNENAKAEMLEFTGQGLNALEKRLEHKEKQMAILGARLLEGQVTKQEAAETVKLRHSGDAVVLKTTAMTISLGLTILLRWHAWWTGAVAEPNDDKISVALNTDFVATRLTAEELKALVLALQAGAISFETFQHALTRGDWSEPGIDVETERKRIDAGPGLEQDDDDDEDLDDVDDPNKGKGTGANA